MQNNHPTPTPIIMPKRRTKVSFILAIVFGVLVVALIGLSVWLWLNYSEQKNNVDAIAANRVAEATKEQAEKLEKEFAEREKNPMLQFTGPEDFGRLVFMYPKTWSMYVVPGLPYRAYLHPKFVANDSKDARYAIRVLIEAKTYEEVIAGYARRVEKGLSSKSIEVGEEGNKVLATRFDGALSDKVVGSAVVFKIRDKTVTVQTDIETFRPDFDKLISSIIFNK